MGLSLLSLTQSQVACLVFPTNKHNALTTAEPIQSVYQQQHAYTKKKKNNNNKARTGTTRVITMMKMIKKPRIMIYQANQASGGSNEEGRQWQWL